MFDVKIFNKIEGGGGFRGESLIINILVFEVKICYFLFEEKNGLKL